MPKRLSVLGVAAAIAFIETTSHACRVSMPPDRKISYGYASGAISSVALITITHADYTRPPTGDAHPWSASAKIKQVIRGSYPARTVQFERGWGSAGCDDGHPAPKAGERWIAYFWQRGPGDQDVWVTYPADIAYGADPLLALGNVPRLPRIRHP